MSQLDFDNLPEGWATPSLLEVIRPITEKIEPHTRPDVPYLSLEHLESNTNRIIGHGVASDVKSTKSVFHPGDVLYGKLRPYLNKVVIPDREGICSTDILVFRPPTGLMSQWLMWFLSLPDVVQFATDHQKGLNLPRISFGELATLKLPLPPLAEQERIVEKLEVLIARMRSVQQRLFDVPNILKHFRQTVLTHACSGTLTEDWRGTDVVDEDTGLPQDWLQRPLSELCTAFQYGSSQKSDETGEVPVLRMGNLQDGRIDWSNLKFSSDEAEIDKYSLEPNTVLFNRTNSPELVGKTAIYRGERPAIFAGYLIRLVHGPEVDPEYLNLCLNEQAFREYCMRVKSDGVSQSNINAKKLAAYKMLQPPIAEQQEIVRRVNDLFVLADSIEQRVAEATTRTESMTQSILARAFHGELVPTETDLAAAEGRDYETAEQLLGRIRTELSNRPKSKRKGRKPMAKKKTQRRILTEVLNDATDPLTPETLFSKAGYDDSTIEQFYCELRVAIGEGTIVEERPNDTDVYLRMG